MDSLNRISDTLGYAVEPIVFPFLLQLINFGTIQWARLAAFDKKKDNIFFKKLLWQMIFSDL